MNLFKPKIKRLVENKDYKTLSKLLSNNPSLANEGISIPYSDLCRIKAHPLHRLCDAVFEGKMTEEEAIKLAEIFLENGAYIDGDKIKDDGTPILAAASLHAEQLGIFYIENGADIHYTYKNDGASALHWAAFCGRDKLVDWLIQANAVIDELDIEHKSTPLGWAIHALITNDELNAHNQISCIKLLLKAGANTEKLNKESKDFLYMLAKDDLELQNLLK
ncbi:MAG: ankyrin repeat domain-containing protein [Flavobacterium sp.]